jgi:2-iminobutanoate/2-iminopropanoate deaminase
MTSRHLALVALTTALVLSGSAAAPLPQKPPSPEFINLVEPWPYPFSSAVRAGDLLFLSGQIGSEVVDGAPRLVAGGIEAETKQAFENIKAILARAGSSMDRVVKCSVMMADMAEWPRMNTIYATYFPGKKPARSAWGATGLALGARVEIECTALARAQ